MANHDVFDQSKDVAEQSRSQANSNDPAMLRPRHAFRDMGEFSAFAVEHLGATVDGEGLRGSTTRTGRDRSGKLGDPVLDAIASPDGQVVIGDETIDLRGGGAAARGPGGGAIAHAAPLEFTEIVNGAERWASADGSEVEYRLGTGRLIFRAWKDSSITRYWSMGAEIIVTSTPAKFQRADIESRYIMSVDTPCQLVRIDSDSDSNDDYLEESEWGWNSQQPERVASRCRALWHNAMFADIVTAGSGCEASVNEPPWDAGFPAEWNPTSTLLNLNGDWTDGSGKNAVITVELAEITINMSAFGRPSAKGSIDDWDRITVRFPDDTSYTGTLQAPNKIRWSNNSVWTKVVTTIFDLNGRWTDGSDRTAVIHAGAKAIKVDMSDFDRPNASGSITNNTAISVKFPDDQTYTAQLQALNVIRWSNNSVWTKRP